MPAAPWHTASMNTFKIRPADRSGFEIIITGPSGDNGHIIQGFPSREWAQAWLDSQLRPIRLDTP